MKRIPFLTENERERILRTPLLSDAYLDRYVRETIELSKCEEDAALWQMKRVRDAYEQSIRGLLDVLEKLKSGQVNVSTVEAIRLVKAHLQSDK